MIGFGVPSHQHGKAGLSILIVVIAIVGIVSRPSLPSLQDLYFLIPILAWFGAGLLIFLAADISMRWSNKFDREQAARSAEWAITEEWHPCGRCGGPARVEESFCEGCS